MKNNRNQIKQNKPKMITKPFNVEIDDTFKGTGIL